MAFQTDNIPQDTSQPTGEPQATGITLDPAYESNGPREAGDIGVVWLDNTGTYYQHVNEEEAIALGGSGAETPQGNYTTQAYDGTILFEGGRPTSAATGLYEPYPQVRFPGDETMDMETWRALNRDYAFSGEEGGWQHPADMMGYPEYGSGFGATVAGDTETDTGTGSGDYGGGYGYSRRGGGYGGGSYGRGGGYGSSGGGGYGTDYYGAMRGAGLNAGAMGRALRGAMGAPIPQMPGQYGDKEEGGRRPAYVPGGASVDSYGNPQVAPEPYHASTPPWPGAYQTGLYGGGGVSSGSSGAAPPSIASARARLQGAAASARARLGGSSYGGTPSFGSAPASSSGALPPTATGGGGPGQPPTERITGWAKRQGYSAPAIQDILYYHPEAALPDVFPGLKTTDPGYQMLANIPVDPQAVMMMGKGAEKKGWTPGAGDYANFLNRYYTDLGGAQRQLDPGQMTENLLDPRKGSALDLQMQSMTPEQQGYTLNQYYQSVTGAMPPTMAAAYQGYMGAGVSDYYNKQLGKKPTNAQDIGKFIDRRYF